MSEEATIRRGTRNARYITVPNHVFEDDRLSMEARWLLGYLLSKPDHWTVRLGDIRKKGGCGRDKARAMVAELVKAGYAEKEPARKDGKFNGLCLVIYDEPRASGGEQSDSVASLPQPEKPSPVQPSTVFPSPVNPPLVNTEGLAIPQDSIEKERGRDDERKTAERWLKDVHRHWPSYVSDSAPKALAAAMTLTAEQRDCAAARMGDYLASARVGGRTVICTFAVYLAEKRWEKLPPPAATQEPPTDFAPPFGPVWGAFVVGTLLTGGNGAAVEHLYRMASLGKGWRFGERWQAMKPLMVAVPVASPEFEAWRMEFERRGWPWLPDPGQQRVVYFPAGGPEALDAFENAIRGTGNDGDRREAAE